MKDLKTRLSELGLSTTGLKGELVDRLQSASSQETQTTSKDETHTEQSIDKPPIQHLQDVDPTAPLEPIVILEKAEIDKFTEPLDCSMVPSIPQPQAPTKPPISTETPVDPVIPSENPIHSESTVPNASAAISALTEPQTDIGSSKSAESTLEPEATDGNLPIFESIEMQNASQVAFRPHSSVIPTEPASLIPTRLEFTPVRNTGDHPPRSTKRVPLHDAVSPKLCRTRR